MKRTIFSSSIFFMLITGVVSLSQIAPPADTLYVPQPAKESVAESASHYIDSANYWRRLKEQYKAESKIKTTRNINAVAGLVRRKPDTVYLILEDSDATATSAADHISGVEYLPEENKPLSKAPKKKRRFKDWFNSIF